MMSDSERNVNAIRPGDYAASDIYRVNALDPEADRNTQEQFQEQLDKKKKSGADTEKGQGGPPPASPDGLVVEDRVILDSVPGPPASESEAEKPAPPAAAPVIRPPKADDPDLEPPTGRHVNIVI
ncbi:MAG: hypothetical protein JXR37_14105 [Kiritimatiellae bacterium]|nr:hypothetical protein [Kiritimatiellia bacterium]